LLLIHGFSASLHTWEPWVERLGDRYRILSLDLPGHGLTRAPAGYQASMEAFRDIVAEFARAQELTRFAIAGSSMGGNVAWEYALAHPGQVEALILVDASGWEDTREETREEPTIFKLLRNPTLGPILRDLDNTRLIRQGLETSFADPAFVDETMVARYSELARAPGHRDILLQLTLGFRARNYATTERLAPLSMPVLILWGDQDRLVPPEHAQLFREAIPQAQLIMFENVGHIPQEEVADTSATAVDEFLYAIHEGPALATAAQ
jgi:pimeloyl-ACP methyl ester carboxylesterase